MLAEMKDPRLERKMAAAGSQWREEDLQEILDLLDKDHTKPQPKPQPKPRDELELEELKALLDMDYTKPQPKPQPKPRDELELDDLKALLDMDYTKGEPEKAPHFPPLFGGGPLFTEPEEQPEEVLPQKEATREVAVPTLGEQADFSETAAEPSDPRKDRMKGLVLTLVGVLELAGIAAVALWWRQWIG